MARSECVIVASLLSNPPFFVMSLSVPQQRLQEWTKAKASALAGYPDDGQIASYLISLPSKQELADYAKVSSQRNALRHFSHLPE